MTGELTQSERQLFDELIMASQKLATGVDNYGVIMDEKFEGVFRDPLRELQAVLRKCPQPQSQWDGSVREEDVESTPFWAPGQQPQEHEPRGVRLRHTITGIERESYTGTSQRANKDVAMKSLEKAVRERFDKMPKPA
jgi:hypothetical protein